MPTRSARLDPDERRDLERPPGRAAGQRASRSVAHGVYDASAGDRGEREAARSRLPGVRARGAHCAIDRRVAAPGRATHTIASTIDGAWVETAVPGARMKILAIDRAAVSGHDAAQGRAGRQISAPSPASGPEECYVIIGSLIVEGRVLRARRLRTTRRATAITARRGPTKAWRCCSWLAGPATVRPPIITPVLRRSSDSRPRRSTLPLACRAPSDVVCRALRQSLNGRPVACGRQPAAPSCAEPIRNGRSDVVSDHERSSRSAIAYDRPLFRRRLKRDPTDTGRGCPSPQDARAVTLPSAWAGGGSRHEPETGCIRHGLE